MSDASSTTPARARLASLVDALDRAFDGPSWHGPSLGDALDGLTEEEAGWRPAPGAHNAWEFVVHADYWTDRVLQHVAVDPPPRFAEPGSNFFTRPAGGALLGDDIRRLRDRHAALRQAAAALAPRQLDGHAYDAYTIADVLAGVAAHHLYHAGQIRLLRRLYELA